MFLQPVLFFGAALWVAAFVLAGVFMLFRRTAQPVSVHDRLVGCGAMILIGVLGAAAVVGIQTILSELF